MTETNEEWCKIHHIFNAEGYLVSPLGRIKGKTGKILLAKPNPAGYIKIKLAMKDGTEKKKYAHRIVAFTFIENDDPINKTYVNHINGITTDNRVVNLEWVTPKENTERKIKKMENRRGILVSQFDKEGKFIKKWNSLKQVSEFYNIKVDDIKNSCKNNTLLVDYYWKYEDDVLENEIWKDLQINDNQIIRISTMGRILTEKGIISYGSDIEGYLIFHTNDAITTLRVHRLVCMAFKENDDPINKTQVNHIDGNKHNNKIENLEWIKPADNNEHAWTLPRAKTSGRAVLCFDKEGNFIKEYERIIDASRETGATSSSISAVCRNRNRMKSTKGYVFKYKE